MLSFTSRHALLVVALASGCGGKVVVDKAGDSGGVGGAGGSPTSSTTTVVTVSSSSSSSATVSSSTGSGCVDGDDCGDCYSCANDGPCKALADACLNDPDCASFEECTSGCQDIGPKECLDLCLMDHPVGGKEYLDWTQCSACSVCAISCQVAFSFFCT